MKRTIIILLSAVLVLVLAACGGKEGNNLDITGYYELVSVTAGSGAETTDEDIQMLKDLGMTASLECFEGGKAVLDLFGDTLDLTYDTSKMTFTINGEEAGFKFTDGNIILEDGDNTLTFAPAQKD